MNHGETPPKLMFESVIMGFLMTGYLVTTEDASSESSYSLGSYPDSEYSLGKYDASCSSPESEEGTSSSKSDRCTRYCSRDSTTSKGNKQCNGLPTSLKGKKLSKIRSFMDIRSQLLQRAVMQAMNKRAARTVGAVENIGFDHPA